MNKLRAGAAAFGLLLPAVLTAAAQEEPPIPKEAQEVIQKAAALGSYRTKFLLEAKDEEGQTFRLKGTLIFQKPQQRRLEIYQADADQPSQVLVADGTVEWQYYPQDGVVYRALNPPPPPGPHRPFAEVQPGTLRFIGLVEEKGERRLRFEGEPLPSMKEGAPVSIRKMGIEVGEQDGLARKLELLDGEGKPVLSQNFIEIQINVAVEKNQFLFIPPKGLAILDIPYPEPAEPPQREGF